MDAKPPRKRRTLIVAALAIIAVVVIVVLFDSLAGWSAPSSARKMKNPVPATESAIDDGMFNYSKHCKSCHGENGDGNGDRAHELSVMPSDFTDAREMSRATDGELFWKITNGHRPMPAFQNKLTDTERWEVVDYIRTFAKKSAP
ncbi:MAG TPA: cytochrome c [Candidatus Acidoferrales bacterium]|nr:cytochrome c [Candidatus Acidoferrales bacterium]